MKKRDYSITVTGLANGLDDDPPAKPTATADITTPTNGAVTVTAEFSEDSIVRQYSMDEQTWSAYTKPIVMTENGTVYFRALDDAGNISDTEAFAVENIDTTAPDKPVASADITELTNSDVTVTAAFSDDSVKKEYTLDGGETWQDYPVDGVIIINGSTVGFRATDEAGNTSEVENYVVGNIDKDAPVISLEGDAQTPAEKATLTAAVDDDSALYYRVGDFADWKAYTGAITITANGTYYFRATDAAGNVGTAEYVFRNILQKTEVEPETQTWEEAVPAEQYIVEYSTDDFEHVIRLAVNSASLDSFRMPAGSYQVRVKPAGSEDEWTVGEPLVIEETASEPKFIKSDEDGNADVFFAGAVGTWEYKYQAQHDGSVGDWAGTQERAALYGRNKLTDVIEGSTDANILLMTDDACGDAMFVDDIFSAMPGSVIEQQARIARIDEIRAGAGADVVDMTSQRFEYVGEGLTIRGGDGNDVIWANKGDNRLFGDAGNDRIVGASGNDVIAGGIGNDSMHGGGGSDVFTFCDNWGTDTVEQLETGSVTLWFASGSESNWNASTLTYTDGDNSVTVSGVTADKIELKFGDDGSEQFAALSGMGAFDAFTSQRIFEESDKGILA